MTPDLFKVDLKFQSTPSAWRETIISDNFMPGVIISIHSLRMEGDRSRANFFSWSVTISIHSLRMEGDTCKYTNSSDKITISIHSLRMEGDYLNQHNCAEYRQFQSTPSAWRETPEFLLRSISPIISIHSLRMEGDR